MCLIHDGCSTDRGQPKLYSIVPGGPVDRGGIVVYLTKSDDTVVLFFCGVGVFFCFFFFLFFFCFFLGWPSCCSAVIKFGPFAARHQ